MAQEKRCSREQGVANVVVQNIRALLKSRQQFELQRTTQERIADVITKFFGSMWFLYVNFVWFTGWMVINMGWTPLSPFDPYPFGLLTMIVSLEAIFLSTFVLISQNRMAAQNDRRSELDLQINLLSEHEVTKVLRLVDALVDHFHLKEGKDAELNDLKQDTDPNKILRNIDAAAQKK